MSNLKKQQVKRVVVRNRRKMRVRSRIIGTPERPRLCVHRSLVNMYVQIIDDSTGTTLVSASTRDAAVIEVIDSEDTKVKKGYKVGLRIAELAKEKGIGQVRFDRQSSLYHGRVKSVADGARKGGLKF
ncbi:MAG: 50S ribosomal protein L18 [candidate division Zixibacteria bacterium]|nr:50S ribosomal protein L18 [candidate division Zixibacteria bacterium]